MAWPTGGIDTTQLDSNADSPSLARPSLLAAVNAVNDMAASLGTPGGPASLDGSGQVPLGQLGNVLPAGIGPLPYAGPTAPSGWLLCFGQAVSRVTYAALFAAIGTSHGAGDGSTTFNLPDMRGRVPAGKDDMGGTAAGNLNVTLTGTTTAGSAVVTGISSTAALAVGMQAIGANIPAGRTIASIDSATQVTLNSGTSVTAGTASIRFGVIDGATLGATGGSQVHALTTPQMPAHTHTITALSSRNTSAGGSETIADTSTNTSMTTNSTGGGQAHPNIQPTLVTNYIIKT